MSLKEIEEIKKDIRGSETIDDIIYFSDKKLISLDRIKIEKFL